MKEYKNTGKLVGFIVSGRTFSFQNGEVVEVDDNFKENIQDHLEKIVEVKTNKPTILGEYPMKEVKPGMFEADMSKPKVPEERLNEMSFVELRKLGDAWGLKFRSKEEAIRELLEAMK